MSTHAFATLCPTINTSSARILIAGCGDLGLRIAARLLAESSSHPLSTDQHSTHQVWGLRRRPPHAAESPVKGLEWIEADLTEPESLTHLPASITHVIYAAAAHERTEGTYRAVYLRGLQNLVAALDSSTLQRVLFVSSTAVYGDHGSDWVDENTLPAPKNFNGSILLEAERWLEQQRNRFCSVSLRLSGIYGPGRQFLVDRLKLGQAAAPEVDTHWVNRIHIDDAAAAIEHLLWLPTPETIYLITDSTPLPMRSLYEALARLVSGPTPPLGSPPASVGSKRLSNARLRTSGFEFKWPDTLEGYGALLSKRP